MRNYILPIMQHLKEFLTRIQTFNLRITKQKVGIEKSTNNTKEMDAYDITRETQYYDSFSYKSELRVLKDMAYLDILVLDKEHISIQLAQLYKVKDRFKELWANYHMEYSEYHQVYKSHYVFTIRLDTLFIVHNLRGDSDNIGVSGQFVEDLGDSIKLRENFLMELISDTENSIKEKKVDFNFEKSLQSKQEPTEESLTAEPEVSAKAISRYPTFTAGIGIQLFDLLRDYFVAEDHGKLRKLLLNDEAPSTPLVFRGYGNQLADAFKQLFDANLIVGCLMADLEKWIAPKFMFLADQSEPRELTEGYLNSLMSTKTRPCKSTILKIEQKENKFIILPTPRNKK